MKRWSRYTTLVVTILMVLAISAMQVVPVLADDGAPPPTETPEVAEPATGEVVDTPSGADSIPEAVPADVEEVVPEATPVATEAPADAAAEAPVVTEEVPAVSEEAPAVSEEAPAAEEAVVGESAPTPEQETPAQVLAQVPENTDIVILNENGEVLSLASEEAAEVFYNGDPIWCPVGVAPKPGVGGCTASFVAFNPNVTDAGLLSALANKTVPGVIWIAYNYNGTLEGGTAVTLNSGLGTTTNYGLTIKGGWSGTPGSTVVNSLTPSNFNVALNILNWTGAITLSDIVISGATSGPALNVATQGNITATNVKVGDEFSHNTGAGAVLDNSTGTGNVAVTNGNFSYNDGGTGLDVISNGTITLNNVKTNHNGGSGASLNNAGAATAKNVTLTTGTLEFNNNGNWGLIVFSKGAIALKDITANGNGLDGAQLINTASTTAQAVTLTGTNIFSENGRSGLFVQSNGAIKTNNLIANGNRSFEAVYLDNAGAASAQSVTLTGTNEFKFNDEGLRIFSKGAVTLNNVTAINNFNGSGVFINNTSSGHLAPQNVTLTGYGTFNNNGSNGLQIVTYGAIAATNVEANNNGGYGALLNNYGDDGAGGLDPSFSDGYATLAKAVTLSVGGGNPDTNANDNYSGGLYISSLGAISLSGLNASNNGWDCSAAPDPCTPVVGSNGAYLNNDHPNAVGGITLSGWGAATGNNGGSGLEAYSRGAITLTNLWTWNNQNYGAYLDNSSGAGAVTISGGTGHWNNSWDGLTIYSKGAITLGTITANNNGGSGVILDNTASGTVLPQNVTLNGANHEFNWNGANGLEISSYGMITLNNLYANGNQGSGALIDNCLQSVLGTCSANLAKAITLNGNNTFERNGGNGLDLTSKGVITVNNLVARDNGGFGAFFDNLMTGTTAAINVKNTPTYYPEFARNGLDGLRLTSNGTITVMDLDAYQNGTVGDSTQGGYGVYLYNAGTNGIGNIILGTSRPNWTNGLNNNYLSGLEVYSNGTVTLSNLRANDNGRGDGNGYGVYVDNSTSSLPKAVMLKGTNDFINDYNGGLYILSRGAITLNNISANDSGIGVYLDNTVSGTSAPQNITLTGFGDFFNNWSNGLEVYTYGAITLNNVNASDNGQRSYQCELNGDCPADSGSGFGVYLYNAGATAAIKPAVTLNGNNNFRNNADYGLQIVSLGAIKVNNLDASNNGVWWDCTDTGCATILPGFGAWLDNSGAGVGGGVTITGNAFTTNNSDYGLQITSKGAITINVIDMWAGNNGGFGWNLDNHLGSGGVTLTAPAPNTDWAFDFSNNGEYGLWVQSRGNITIAGLDASNNGSFGAALDNSSPGATGTVTITAPAAGNNDFSGNISDGLVILSNRAITIGKLEANGNGWDCSGDPCVPVLSSGMPGSGVILENDFVASNPITITGFANLNNNAGDGLAVYTYGKITLANITASDNGQYNKAALPGDVIAGFGYGAYLDNATDTVVPQAIVLTGANNFNNNFLDGLSAIAKGAITINNLNASNNSGNGAYLDNQVDGAVGGITLTTSTATGWNTFDGNGNLGLAIFSHGAITSNNIQANNNRGGGASLDTDGVSIPQAVTLNGRNLFRGNGDNSSHTAFGLTISADGNITLNNVTALWNDGDGVYLDSCQFNGTNCTGVGNILLKGTNNFRGNYDDGIYFDAGGTAILTKVAADGNGNDGIQGYAKSITLTCGSLTSNGNYGWWLSAWGTPNLVTLQGVFAYGNGAGNTLLDSGTLVQTRTCPLP